MGRERERAARDLAFRGFIVDERLMRLASASAIFLQLLAGATRARGDHGGHRWACVTRLASGG
jgi:hypothetical protein